MTSTKRKAGFLFAPLLLGAASAGWSPIGCGCYEPEQVVADTYRVPLSKLTDADVVGDAIKRHFESYRYPAKSLDEWERQHCSIQDDGWAIHCRYPLWKKPGYVKSLEFTVQFDGEGRCVGTSVAYPVATKT